jgi:hypothetical protein
MVAFGSFFLGLLLHAYGHAALYGATGSNGVSGVLYQLSPSDGSVISTVGPLLVGGTIPVGITGLAFHPQTRVLYGATSNGSPNFSGQLVTVTQSIR